MPTIDNAIAEAIVTSLSSPNVVDSNLEPANVVDVLADIAAALRRIAEALEARETRRGL